LQLCWIQLLLPYLLDAILSPGQTLIVSLVSHEISKLDFPPPVPWILDVEPLPTLVELTSIESELCNVCLGSNYPLQTPLKYLLYPGMQALDHVYQYYSFKYPQVCSSLSLSWRTLWLSLLTFACWLKALLSFFHISIRPYIARLCRTPLLRVGLFQNSCPVSGVIPNAPGIP